MRRRPARELNCAHTHCLKLVHSSSHAMVRFQSHAAMDPRARLTMKDLCGQPRVSHTGNVPGSTMAPCTRKGQSGRLHLPGDSAKRDQQSSSQAPLGSSRTRQPGPANTPRTRWMNCPSNAPASVPLPQGLLLSLNSSFDSLRFTDC